MKYENASLKVLFARERIPESYHDEYRIDLDFPALVSRYGNSGLAADFLLPRLELLAIDCRTRGHREPKCYDRQTRAPSCAES